MARIAARNAAPMLPGSSGCKRMVLTTGHKWHCADDSNSRADTEATTSVGRERSTLLVSGTTWIVPRPGGEDEVSSQTTAGRTKPASLPAGMAKSTLTTSPARIFTDYFEADIEPTPLVGVQLDLSESLANAPLTLGSYQTVELLAQGESIVVGKLPEFVAGSR
jgi:hypothetical protein